MLEKANDYNAIARGLSLTGGGVRGLFTASALQELEKISGRKINDSFDVFAGTSAGGIISIALAAGVETEDIVQLFRHKAFYIFGEPALFNPFRSRTASHDPARLKKVICEVLGDSANTRIRDLERNVIISSVNAKTNEIVYFSNVERIGSIDCHDASLVDAAMATSAAPTFFPPHKIGEVPYIDGGVVSNSPDFEALHFLMSYMMKASDHVQLLSVGTGKTFFEFDTTAEVRHGAYTWLKKHRLIDRIISLQENKASHFVSDILINRYLRIDAHFDFEIELDTSNPEILRRLNERGVAAARAAWEANPGQVASFLR